MEPVKSDKLDTIKAVMTGDVRKQIFALDLDANITYPTAEKVIAISDKAINDAYSLGREAMRQEAVEAVDNLPVTGLNHEICSDCQSIAMDAIKSLK